MKWWVIATLLVPFLYGGMRTLFVGWGDRTANETYLNIALNALLFVEIVRWWSYKE